MSAGQRLLDAGMLECLKSVDDWERLRLGIQATSSLQDRKRVCPLCGSFSHGLGHLLAVCVGTLASRDAFLGQVDGGWGAALKWAPAGDRPAAVLSPQIHIDRLAAAVGFGADVTKLLRGAQASSTENK